MLVVGMLLVSRSSGGIPIRAPPFPRPELSIGRRFLCAQSAPKRKKSRALVHGEESSSWRPRLRARRYGLGALNVGRPNSAVKANEFGIIFPQMRDQVVERQEGMTDMGFGPVDEDAALRTDEDIARIEIGMAQGVWNAC